jgi:hypothetical protein
MRTLGTLVSSMIAVTAILTGRPAIAESDLPIILVQTRKPADLDRYSFRFWPRNTLRKDQIVSADTPYGRLTCRSNGVGRPRTCSLYP